MQLRSSPVLPSQHPRWTEFLSHVKVEDLPDPHAKPGFFSNGTAALVESHGGTLRLWRSAGTE
jgi:hypothetical protein